MKLLKFSFKNEAIWTLIIHALPLIVVALLTIFLYFKSRI